MVKSPLVYVAGAAAHDRPPASIAQSWTWLLDGMGQVAVPAAVGRRLGLGHRWLSTNTMKARFRR